MKSRPMLRNVCTALYTQLPGIPAIFSFKRNTGTANETVPNDKLIKP